MLPLAVSFDPLALTVFLLIVGLTIGLSFYWELVRSQRAGTLPRVAGSTGLSMESHLPVTIFRLLPFLVSAASSPSTDTTASCTRSLSSWMDRRAVRGCRAAKANGKYTFADALDSKFQSRGIQIAVGLSTLAVSIFYLIPQMVGAGALIDP